MTITSASGLFGLEVIGGSLRLFKSGCLLWETHIEVEEGERKFYLGDGGWLVVEVVSQGWGLITTVDPEGLISGKLATAVCDSRHTWPPAHFPLLIIAEWPPKPDGGPFFASWRPSLGHQFLDDARAVLACFTGSEG